MIGKIKKEKPKPKCKGIVFKCSGSQWVDLRGMFSRKVMRVLKRKSCPGCLHCIWVMEFLQEDTYDSDEINALDGCEPGKCYTVKVNSSQDWESGIWEIDDWEFVEFHEPAKAEAACSPAK
jgi:hypothetical protein